ncbi:MAG TPA: aldo/keto reductase [Candidatus Aquilonibacter sp.]|nr:aldo/keto reductase [Candidatus Aquilonibacter sp.]
MEYRALGSTSVEISRIGFGCGPASGYDYGPIDEAEWKAAVRVALDAGVTLFDVANVYGFGRAEELLAEALGERRLEVVIATKCGLAWDDRGRVYRDLTPSGVRGALEGSLRRLRVDCVPLYQIHWPDPVVAIEETMDALARCQNEGKIRFVGVGNFPPELLERAFGAHRFESQQIAFNLLHRQPERDVFPWAEAAGVSNLAHSALARGLLAGRRPIGTEFGPADTRGRSPYFSAQGKAAKQRLLDAIRVAAAETGKPFASVAIRWLLDHPQMSTVLVGMKNRKQAEENLDAVGWKLAPETLETLSELSTACPGGLAGIPAHAA